MMDPTQRDTPKPKRVDNRKSHQGVLVKQHSQKRSALRRARAEGRCLLFKFTLSRALFLFYKMAYTHGTHGTQLETVVLLKNTTALDLNPPSGICSKGLWPCHGSPHAPPRWRGRPGSAKLWKGKGEFLVPLT